MIYWRLNNQSSVLVNVFPKYTKLAMLVNFVFQYSFSLRFCLHQLMLINMKLKIKGYMMFKPTYFMASVDFYQQNQSKINNVGILVHCRQFVKNSFVKSYFYSSKGSFNNFSASTLQTSVWINGSILLRNRWYIVNIGIIIMKRIRWQCWMSIVLTVMST